MLVDRVRIELVHSSAPCCLSGLRPEYPRRERASTVFSRRRSTSPVKSSQRNLDRTVFVRLRFATEEPPRAVKIIMANSRTVGMSCQGTEIGDFRSLLSTDFVRLIGLEVQGEKFKQGVEADPSRDGALFSAFRRDHV